MKQDAERIAHGIKGVTAATNQTGSLMPCRRLWQLPDGASHWIQTNGISTCWPSLE